MAAVHAGGSADEMAARCEGGAVQHGGGACRRNADQTAADARSPAKNRAAIHRRMPAPVRSRASQGEDCEDCARRRVLNQIASKEIGGKARHGKTAPAPGSAGCDRGACAGHRRSRRMATTASRATKVQGRRMRTSDGIEVGRAVGQLNQDDRRAFRSRCGQILSAPGKFARSHVEICTAASVGGRKENHSGSA